jgi:hypothetical protein
VADRGGLAVPAGVALVAAVLFFPGFAYGVGKDPGVYVSHAIAMARLGSSSLEDPVLDRNPTVELLPQDPVNRLPAIYIKERDPGRVIAQFYHLWPALLASAFQAGGYTGLVNLTPCAACSPCSRSPSPPGVPSASSPAPWPGCC